MKNKHSQHFSYPLQSFMALYYLFVASKGWFVAKVILEQSRNVFLRKGRCLGLKLETYKHE